MMNTKLIVAVVTAAVLSLSITLLQAVRGGADPFDEVLSDTELAGIAGLDPNSQSFESNCAYTTLDPSQGEVAWRDCNGEPDHTWCILCQYGSYTSFEPGPGANDVQKSGAALRCEAGPITKLVGTCFEGVCGDYMVDTAGCTGSPSVYEPQSFPG